MIQSPDKIPARILIVDDERPNRQLLEVMLTPEGFELLTAASGEEALAIVARQPPDLILLDIMMPGMDGYQVAAKLKGNSGTKHIPIIMITALNDRNARMLGLGAGAEDFLTKPVDRAELSVRVRNLLRLKAYGDYYDRYSQMLEDEVATRTADLVERTKSLEQQTAVLTEQAALLDLAQDAIVVQDMHSRILFWSRGAELMYGWPSNEVVGRETWDIFKTEFSEPTDRMRQGQWEGEAVHYRRDGSRVMVASRWALQRDAGGAPVRILTINTDITDRKELDSELLLLTAREEARKDQMRFKDEFLSHVSHELRSPLTAIKQFTSILLGGLAGELNKEQREYQQIVLRNIGQLQSMIDDLLEVTRLETGKVSIEPERVSISDAVTDAVNTLEGSARAKGVTLSVALQPDLPPAHADPTRLQQILIILGDNAIKFTPAGGAATIQVRLLPEDPEFLLVEVSDTGIGIRPEMTERVFERLYQASEHTAASRKGLGLGLHICKELVTRQGGKIWAKRRLEQGSTFAFTLPVFSLSSVIAPLLKNDQWPTETVALVTVDLRLLNAWPSKESREEWSKEARGLVHRCLMPDLDVLLPKTSSDTQEERFFVTAFGDEEGVAILTNRIREQFAGLPRLKQSDATIAVSYEMLPPASRGAGASTDKIVKGMATRFEAAIKSHVTPEAYHE